MTTNAFLLESMASPLQKAGLTEINVSLDAIDNDIFYKVSRKKGVDKVIAGILAATKIGLTTKLNMVVMKGINDSQILPVLNFAIKNKIKIRFLELMKMGHLADSNAINSQFLSLSDMLKVISSTYQFSKLSRTDGATAEYYQINDSNFNFGVIANESKPFCGDCNRLRLDQFGNIYGCLSSNIPISIKQDVDDSVLLTNHLRTALSHKQAVKFTGSNLSMMKIGG